MVTIHKPSCIVVVVAVVVVVVVVVVVTHKVDERCTTLVLKLACHH